MRADVLGASSLTKAELRILPLWCNALLRRVSWWALWWGSLDGRQGVTG
jgi:hypothetical protein